MADTFKINEVAFDMEAKEHVKISNLYCPICKQGNKHPDVANGSHPVRGVECATVPFEAVALRVVGLKVGVPLIGFTYRQVKVEHLRKVASQSFMEQFLELEKPKHFEFIGRI